MIGTSLPEYLFIRASIWGLRAITPLSIFYCSFCIADPPVSRAGKALLGYCAIETGFWLLVYLPRKRSLQAAAVHPTPLPREERKELFWKSWDQIPNPEYYLSKWMAGAKPKDVRRDNVKDFYRWAFLNRGDGELKGADLEEEEHELDEYVDGVQTLLGRDIEPGRGGAQALRLTTDNVKMLHRPLLWYSIVGLVDTLTAMYLYYSGFRFHRTPLKSWLSVFPFRICSLFTRRASPAPDISYWYRPHTSKTRLPILFIHGISMGLYSYAQFLAEINKHDPRRSDDGDIGIIAIEIMPISFRITGPVLGRDEICRQINIILERHGFSKVVLASHSYGSVITTHLLQNPSIAAKIGPMLLIDPVIFLLHLPDVAYNFTARKPRGANEWQLYYFACTDMMVAHTLARHFFWSQNILWKDDIRGHDVTVSLGGRDQIIDAQMVGKYLAGVDLKGENVEWKNREWTGHGLETTWFPTCDHAQVFERKDGRQKLGDVIRRYAESRREDDELP
jgi:pimeloyl-ACP methyl ester carboxylesterase